ncbi:fumarylacetoacetate hydrolase family protein [Wenxinia marina]|uniref:2-keto-4-pentenoate hydratase/2-oxohepta-3-ene-1,7-dioic acid hydratase (Catechol pathway) n=1 Tax=Wenxinia marina DSM 24838 TaxID=1123501 RepID=A0A0D0QDD0_9RHOB|nr:fumarylacetoacetate hydrolase family protein [Wenxinia marina]KIQ69008.1 2-keto-4-pentenoate hydratase/2-oxohepta-3-ene-1,7-dioic acid hydratase (catechol pathway) [Wenxinia marina DSM 24838]GGL81057.1 5-carboxymethyl-2-hydroxymuconate isomerase [Wenxinia marina]
MRFVSFTRDGAASWGRIGPDGAIIDLGAHETDLKSAIAAGKLSADLDGPSLARGEVRLLPIVPNPAKFLCVGHNYESHRVETGRDPTDHPSIFTRFADTLIGADDPIVRPTASTDLDYEAELAVVIGRGGRNIPEAEAMDHIAGYTCFNDASVRDWQWHSRQFTPGKNFPGTGPLGPELVTPDEIDDLPSVRVESVLNGTVMQSATLDHMLFPVPVIIAYISQFTPLAPGDVIATGTPGGVGAKRTPPVWMAPGDTIEVRISGVGTLSSTVVAEA